MTRQRETDQADLYRKAVREGTSLAALSGFVASSAAVLIILQETVASTSSAIMGAGAIAGGTACMALFWRLMVPAHGTFGIGRAIGAGAVASVAAAFVMWPFTLFAFVGDGLDFESSFFDALWLGAGVSFYFAIIANIFTAWITIPLGIVASVLVTLWARRQVDPDDPSVTPPGR